MQEAYEKAIQKIRELKEILTEKEWNTIAKKENLLSSTSLEYISRRDFYTLQKEVKQGRRLF